MMKLTYSGLRGILVVIAMNSYSLVMAQSAGSDNTSQGSTAAVLDFGMVDVGSSEVRKVYIINSGRGDMRVKQVVVTPLGKDGNGGLVKTEWGRKTVKPGRQCAVSVAYVAPNRGETFDYRLDVISVPGDTVAAIEVTGAVMPPVRDRGEIRKERALPAEGFAPLIMHFMNK